MEKSTNSKPSAMIQNLTMIRSQFIVRKNEFAKTYLHYLDTLSIRTVNVT